MTKAPVIIWFVLVLLISGGGFVALYLTCDGVEVASTGYNATGKGLMGWDYRFQEHEFRPGEEPLLINSGRTIRYKELLLEIGLCLFVGVLVTGLMVGYWIEQNRLSSNQGS